MQRLGAVILLLVNLQNWGVFETGEAAPDILLFPPLTLPSYTDRLPDDYAEPIRRMRV